MFDTLIQPDGGRVFPKRKLSMYHPGMEVVVNRKSAWRQNIVVFQDEAKFDVLSNVIGKVDFDDGPSDGLS